MMYKSKALWPKGTCDFSCNITEDSHDSKEGALAVCCGLEEYGFGGQRKVFPVRTWVEKSE